MATLTHVAKSAEEMLEAYEAALEALLVKGYQSYRIGAREYTNLDLKELEADAAFWRSRLSAETSGPFTQVAINPERLR